MSKDRSRRVTKIAAVMCVIVTLSSFSGVAAASSGPVPTRHVTHRQRSTAAGEQVAAVAGSSRFLAYIEYATVNGKPAKTAQLFERTVHGPQRELGTVQRTSEFSLAGRYLSTGDGGQVRVWNLNTGKEHDRTAPPLTEWRAAAPDGYLVAKGSSHAAGIQKLETVSMSGTIKSLGAPFPSGKLYGVTVNAKRYVAFRDLGQPKPWGAKTATFAHPGHVTTLINSSGQGSSSPATYCGVPSKRFVACDTEAKHLRLQTYRLDGKLVAHTNKYGANFVPTPIMIGSSPVWLTRSPGARLRQLSTSGLLLKSTQKFAMTGPVQAFHQIIVGQRGRTALLELRTATSKPTVLVKPQTDSQKTSHSGH